MRKKKMIITDNVMSAFCGYLQVLGHSDKSLRFKHTPVVLGSLSKITLFLESQTDSLSESLLKAIKFRENLNCSFPNNNKELIKTTNYLATLIECYLYFQSNNKVLEESKNEKDLELDSKLDELSKKLENFLKKR